MKIIKTALLAYGGSGRLFHAPFLEVHDGFELIGAWERRHQNIQSDFPSANRFDSLEAVLESEAELVVVNTPVYTHYEYAKKALEAGKHVLVEKAFTTSSKEARELYRLATEKNLKLCVYQNRRWDSDFLTTQKVLKSGFLGDIVEAEIRFERYNPILSPKVWKETKQPGSGILMDLGAHVIDQAVLLFGIPQSVYADIRMLRPGTEVDDYFDILLYYPNNRVRLKASFYAKEALPAYVLQGCNGSFVKMRGDRQEEDLKQGKNPNRKDWGTEDSALEGILNLQHFKQRFMTEQGNYLEIFDALYRSIVLDEAVPVSAKDACITAQVMEAATKSAVTGCKVEL